MSKFDIEKRRKSLEQFGIPYALRFNYDPALPMGNVALSHIEMMIGAWLVGLEHESTPVLLRATEWIDGALDAGESFGENLDFHMQNLWWGKAIAGWMLGGSNDELCWSQARQCHAAAAAKSEALIEAGVSGGVFSKEDFTTTRLDDYLAFCVGSRQYAEGIEELEKYVDPTIPLKSGITHPRELGYAICAYGIGRAYDQEGLFLAGRKMLRSHLWSSWVKLGQYLRAATWLKIVYSDCGYKLSPMEAISKAHEYF